MKRFHGVEKIKMEILKKILSIVEEFLQFLNNKKVEERETTKVVVEQKEKQKQILEKKKDELSKNLPSDDNFFNDD